MYKLKQITKKKNQQFNKANGLTHLLAQMRLAVCEKKKSFIFNEWTEKSNKKSNRAALFSQASIAVSPTRPWFGGGSGPDRNSPPVVMVVHGRLPRAAKEDGFGLLSESLDDDC